MKQFKSKKQVFEYLIKKFSKNNGVIILRGSMNKGRIKNYSDFDLEIYTKNPRKPYYEIIILNKKIVLLSIWFGLYKRVKPSKKPKNIKIIYGDYMPYMKYIKDKEKYNEKDKIKRECQAAVDWMFKYLRTKNKKYLESVQKRI